MTDMMMGYMALLNPKWYARMLESARRQEEYEFERLKKTRKPEDWDDLKTKFQKLMFLRAASWKPTPLFDVPAMPGLPGERMKPKVLARCTVRCPGTNFGYAEFSVGTDHND